MKKTRFSLLVKILFLLVAVSFLAHEATPHHHHDILKSHNECCHNHNDHSTSDNSCKILNYISSSKTITYNFKISLFAAIELYFGDLTEVLDVKFNSLLLKILEQIPFLLKSQYQNASLLLRAPPLA